MRTATRDGDDAAVRRARDAVDLATRGLGERGDPWWDLTPARRRARWEHALDGLRSRSGSADD